MLSRKHTTVSIPRKLYENIEKRLDGSGFTSVSDYVTYVLREVVSNLEKTDVKTLPENKEILNEDKIKSGLQSLGYL